MTLDILSKPPEFIQEKSIRPRKKNLTRSSSLRDNEQDLIESEKVIIDAEKTNDTEIENEYPSFKTVSRSLKQKKITSYINYQMEKILILTIFILFLVSLWENNWVLGLTILLTIFLIKPILSKIIAGWLVNISIHDE